MNCFDDNGIRSPECTAAILSAMAEALVVVDHKGIIRYCNPAMEQLCGRLRHDIVGQRCTALMDCACGTMDQCVLVGKGNDITSVECSVRRRDGSLVPVLKNGKVVRDAGGKVLGAVETLTDISLLKKTQRHLKELEEKVRAQADNRLLVGRSSAMRTVHELVELAAASEATVLITGETGTGKELVARAIHDRSSRSNGPMVRVNCSALPETLLESELFGHVKGAFTGAVRDKQGRFELADKGTLFLDEIGELSPLIQVKLLRFLQEHEFERVGESTPRKTDVRVIAATHRDLRALIRRGEFREDLYYRLKVFPIHIPPLRERKEDIGPLVEHFIERFRAQTGKQIVGLSHEAAVTMMDYCWPGNIRELENAIEHAFVTCRQNHIGLFDLPLEIRRVELRQTLCVSDGSEPHAGPVPVSAAEKLPTPRLRWGTSAVTRDIVLKTLQEHGGNRAKSAQALGIERTTLWRWMRRFGIRDY